MNPELLPAEEISIPKFIQEEVDKLHATNWLFGSRRMVTYWPYNRRGLVDNLTDWDFAFPYEGSEYQECRRAESLGWVNKPCEKYKDSIHFMTWEKTISGHKVQMCSKINLTLFAEVYSNITPSFYWTYLHKSSPTCLPKEVQTEVFNQMYNLRGL